MPQHGAHTLELLPCVARLAAKVGAFIVGLGVLDTGPLSGLCRFHSVSYPAKAPLETPSTAAGITKAGNGRARRILVEAAWSYRHPPRVSLKKPIKVAASPQAVREIAWKAQTRLCRRFRSLTRKGKRPNVVVTAIARELSAFIWAINREVMAGR